MRRIHPKSLLFAFWLSVVISIAVVLRRLSELVHPSSGHPPPMAALDATFSSHAALTVAHIVPAAIFVILAAAVLPRRRTGEWLRRLFFLFGVITGVTAYAMSRYSIGGWVERSAVLVFDTWFLYSLSRGYRAHVNGNGVQMRRWTTRAVGVLLGIATTRPVMAVFMATSARTHLMPNQFFGIAFWIGFSINTIAVELWLHSKSRARIYAPATPVSAHTATHTATQS
jgi:hypothetical protein